jgi:hypothetical protein
MMTVKIVSVVSLVGLVAGCGSEKTGHAAIAKVERFCAELATELADAADKYRELANIVDPAQKEKANATIVYGGTREQRGRISIELRKRLGFCTSLRKDALVDDKTSTAFLTFAEAEDPLRVAASLSDIAAFAKGIAALPILD